MRILRCTLPLTFAAALLALPTIFASTPETQTLYKTKCGGCHGQEGQGAPSAYAQRMNSHAFSSPEVLKMTDAELIAIMNNGKGKYMPAYKGKLSDDEIKALVAYVRELGGKK